MKAQHNFKQHWFFFLRLGFDRNPIIFEHVWHPCSTENTIAIIQHFRHFLQAMLINREKCGIEIIVSYRSFSGSNELGARLNVMRRGCTVCGEFSCSPEDTGTSGLPLLGSRVLRGYQPKHAVWPTSNRTWKLVASVSVILHNHFSDSERKRKCCKSTGLHLSFWTPCVCQISNTRSGLINFFPAFSKGQLLVDVLLVRLFRHMETLFLQLRPQLHALSKIWNFANRHV